jgi:3-phosphoshikimate 1-carboxyvinyltransferase
MTATINPSYLSGHIKIPPSKSMMQRACALALLNNGTTKIYNFGKSDDELTAIELVKRSGGIVSYFQKYIQIESNGQPIFEETINFNESGLSLRMFVPIIAAFSNKVMITGHGTLLKRSMGDFETIFNHLGIDFKSNLGMLPFQINGSLVPTDIEIEESGSSQYLTGLLFSFAKCCRKKTQIKVNNLVSKAYIDLSLKMLKDFGYDVSHEGYEIFTIQPIQLIERHHEIIIEGDWSSASCLIAGAAVAGNISFEGLAFETKQADVAILEALKLSNANFNIQKNILTVDSSKKLNSFEMDASGCPDLFPALVVLALFADGDSFISGVNRLLNKESNRADSILKEFSKFGAQISVDGDIMKITGGRKINSADVWSHLDHRIAMSLAVAALCASGSVKINDAHVVNKSFPDFFNVLNLLGGDVSLNS